MNQRSEHEQQRANFIKAARNAIRLKHSLAADTELNERLPGLEEDFNAALQRGEAYVLDIASILEEE